MLGLTPAWAMVQWKHPQHLAGIVRHRAVLPVIARLSCLFYIC